MRTAREVMQDFFGGSDGTPDDFIDILLKDREEVREACAKEAESCSPICSNINLAASAIRSLDLSGEGK